MRHLLFLCFVLIAIQLQAQTTVSGKITDHKGKSLPGVSISIKDSYDGATSDSSGNYSFTTSETGNQQLEATISGYSAYSNAVILSGKPVVLNISLKELITELNAVTITAGAFEASDKKKTTVLTPLDIVTTASAQGDITGALKTLPGTQQVGEEGGLFVRGGSAAESKIYIDGTLVNNFFYSTAPGIASRGRFNPFLFKGTVFSSGGYSALYGQALSSALILESNDLPERTEGNLSLSVIGVGGGIQKLAKNKKSSWGATYDFTHLGLAFGVIKQKQDYYNTPIYHQGDANFRFQTKHGGMVKYYGYWNTGKIGFRTSDIDSTSLQNAFDLANTNTYQNLSWRENLKNRWKLQSGISFSTNKDDIANELQDAQDKKINFASFNSYQLKNFSLLSKAWYAQARFVLEKRISGLNTIRFGSDYFYSHETTAYTQYNGNTYHKSLTDHLNALFAESDVYLSKNIAAKIGGRAEHSRLVDEWNLAPRVSLAYKLKDNSQTSFAYGIFYQNPESKYQPAEPGAGFAKATHYILQYQKLTGLRTFRTEVFYKNYDHLFKTGISGQGQEVAKNNDGKGYAKGIEVFWRDKKSIKNLDYWVSYSFLDTKRDYLNFPFALTPNFAAKHTASLVLKKFVMPIKTGFNASYNFATGRPYYRLAYNTLTGRQEVADKGNTINYNNLGFSLNYLPNLGKENPKTFAVFVLSVSNVLGQKQVFTYNYGMLTNKKEAVGPTAKRFIYIGCFLSFGTDQTENVINNNL